jgi:ABC-type glycerol-3-phosphate transport system substrate-binding protein
MKKILLAIVILITIIGFASQITVWVSWEGVEYYKAAAQSYESSHPGVKVKIVNVPDINKKLLLLSSSPQELPDAFMVRGANMLNTATIFKDKIVKVNNRGSVYEKVFKDYAVPLYADVQVLYVNKNIVKDKINSNYTMDDLMDIVSKYKYGLCADFTSPWIFAGILSGRKDLVNSNGNIIVDDKITENTIKFILNMEKEGKFTSFARRAFVVKFKLGDLPFIIQGNFLMKSFENLGFKVEMLPYPKEGEKYKTFKPLIDSKGMVATTKQGLDFAMYLQKSSQLQNLCSEYYKVNYKGYSKVEALKLSLQRGFFEPNTRKYSNGYFKGMRTALLLIMNSHQDINETLKNAQEFIDHN